MENDIPEVSFSQEGRKLEYLLFQEYKKEIMNSKNISKEEKLAQIKLYEDYIKEYEIDYQQYQINNLLLN